MDIIVFDLEANGLAEADTIWCAVLRNYNTGTVTKYRPHEIEEALDHLATADLLVGHNILGYDIPLVERLYNDKRLSKMPTFDTYIASMLFSPDRSRPRGMKGRAGPHGLAAWGYRIGRGKPEHEDWSQFSDDMLHRCSEDVEINDVVYTTLCMEGGLDPTNPLDPNSQWYKSIMLEQRARLYANDIENNGFPIDYSKMQGHIDYLTSEIERIEEEIVPTIPQKPKQYGVTVEKPFKKNGEPSKMVTDWTGEEEAEAVSGPFTRIQWHTINLGSDMQLKEYLFTLGWKPTTWNYKTVTAKESADPSSPYFKQEVGRDAMVSGQKVRTSPKITEDSFHTLEEGLGETLAHYLRCLHRRSLLTGLLSASQEGRVHQQFTGITPTGRYKHALLVNIPGSGWYGHEIRECFTTSEGRTLVGVDAASCQLRMLAHYMRDEAYIKTVTTGQEVDEDTDVYEGTDVHTVNGIAAGLMRQEDVSFCVGKTTEYLKTNHIALWSRIQDGRRRSKNFIYGFLFGAGPPLIAAQLGCTVNEAKRTMDAILKGLPALGRLKSRLDKVHEQRGYLLGLDGRKLFIRSPHMRLVYLLQSAEAIFMKVAWCILREGAKRRGLVTDDVCFMHDEFQTLVDNDDVDAYTSLAHDAFIKAGEYLKLNCPTAGGPKSGNNWSDTH